MTGPKVVHEKSFDKVHRRTRGQKLDQFDQVAQRVQIESPRRATEPLIGAGRRPICPLHRHGKAAALGISQDQRVNAGDATLLEYREAAAPQWMEGMTDLCPSRSAVGQLCSSN